MADTDRLDGWQLDDAGAAAYERNLVPHFFAPFAAELVDRLNPSAGEQVLDVGCGTGIIARHAAERVGADGEVTAVDVSPAMLSAAHETTAGLGNVTIKEASAAELPFPDDMFDVVACQQALQFIPDRAKALAEIARVTKPGGRIGVSTCRSVGLQPGYQALTGVLTRHAGVLAGEVLRSPYSFGEPDELRALVSGAGLRDVHLRIAVWSIRFGSAEDFLQAETSSSPLGDLVGDLDEDVLAELLHDLADALGTHTDDDGLVFPFQTLVVTATR